MAQVGNRRLCGLVFYRIISTAKSERLSAIQNVIEDFIPNCNIVSIFLYSKMQSWLEIKF